MSSSDFRRRLALALPATVLATVSLGAYLYSSGRLRFGKAFPFVRCSWKRSFAAVKPRPGPQQGAPEGGLSVDPSSYPWISRDDVREDMFGVEVHDPYRSLEDSESSRTAAFIESQNFFAEQVLDKCDTREEFKQLFTSMYDTPKFGCPREEVGQYYYRFNKGLQNQSAICVADGDFRDQQVFLDPNEWSEDGTVALIDYYFSENANYMAYTVSNEGSDWMKIKVVAVKPKPVNGRYYDALPDEVNFVKTSGVSWTHDERGFFYCRFPEPELGNGSLGRETHPNKYHYLCYHAIGTQQAEDVVVLKLDDKPENFLGSQVTEDGHYLIISEYKGCHPGNAIHYLDLTELERNDFGSLNFNGCASKITPLIKEIKHAYEFITNDGPLFVFKTNENAPREKLVQVDIKDPKRWKTLVPQQEKDVLEWAGAVRGDKVVTCYTRDCAHVLELRKLSTGDLIHEIDIPEFGTVTSFSSRNISSEVFFSHQSMALPPTVYRFEAEDNNLSVIYQTKIPGFSPEQFQTDQVFVDSYDGKVKIPMFVMHKKDMELNNENPTILTGYGGFGMNMLPQFSVAHAAFVVAYGGVIAQPNLRGGNEHGLEWRKGGSLENKQNTFDDFQACAEFLIHNHYCHPSRLAIRGSSNGGLLAAVCANQRPDLFGAVVCDAGVLDMLRFHKFTVGHAWVPEYGNPDELKAFECIYAYSPLHNVRVPRGGTQQYPSILLTTGDHDDRVIPSHTFKFLAELQHQFCSGTDRKQTNPLIARIETRTGHGHGKPTALIIDEVSDTSAFIAASIKAVWQLK